MINATPASLETEIVRFVTEAGPQGATFDALADHLLSSGIDEGVAYEAIGLAIRGPYVFLAPGRRACQGRILLWESDVPTVRHGA